MVQSSSFTFQDFVANLEGIGFYDVALPFLLIFTITFAVLQKIKIFGPHGKNFNAVVALVMAFLVVRTEAIVAVMNIFLPQVSLISIIIVVTLLLLGLLVGREGSITGGLGGIGILVTIAAIVFAFLTSSGALGWEVPAWLNFSSADWYFIIGLLAFFLLFLYLTSDSGQDKKNPLWEAIKDLPNNIGGGGGKP